MKQKEAKAAANEAKVIALAHCLLNQATRWRQNNEMPKLKPFLHRKLASSNCHAQNSPSAAIPARPEQRMNTRTCRASVSTAKGSLKNQPAN